jgi:deoxycytidylate deaminase
MAYKGQFLRSPLLVFGFSGRIGSGVSLIRDKLAQTLMTFGYEPMVIDVSRVILDQVFNQVFHNEAGSSGPAPNIVKRISDLQLRGNRLREEFGNEAIASLAVSHVIWPWLENERRREPEPFGRRVAFMIDSLKHPHEAAFLREIFGAAYYGIGIVTSDSVRLDRLKNRKGFTVEDFHNLSEIDGDGDDDHGQKAIKTIIKSDYFVANDHSTKTALPAEIDRILRLIFSVEVETPRLDEYGMYTAASAALRSGCLSRQVGASIIAQSGELLSTGRNDVPQVGGGLYTSESTPDHRCWSRSARCYNDFHKQEMVHNLAVKLISELELNVDETVHIKEILNSQIRNLIEFSRAVHAEMDAIVAVAREAKWGLVGATLFCTTFPCHSCARHIIDAGIARVVYLEPYEKSKARDLHADAICDPLLPDEPGKVPFELYGGVAPRRFAELFASHDRKDSYGALVESDSSRIERMPNGAEDVIALESRIRKVVEKQLGNS